MKWNGPAAVILTHMPDTPQPDTINKPFRILALDGGGCEGLLYIGPAR